MSIRFIVAASVTAMQKVSINCVRLLAAFYAFRQELRAFYKQAFVSACLAGNDGDIRFGNLEGFGQKSDQVFIGFAVNRRGFNPDFNLFSCVVVFMDGYRLCKGVR